MRSFFADSGKKGIEVFKREQPAVTVLDLKMPEMDGLAVLKELRALDPAKPVIILTGARSEEVEVEAWLFGATAFIEKEFSLHRLGDVLKRVLGPSGPATP